MGYFLPATFYPPPTKIYPRLETRAVSILSLVLASLSSFFLPRHQHFTNTSLTSLGSQASFPHSLPLSFSAQIDPFVIICSDFQEALSLLVYRNLWYMDAQVCFLKVLFKTWIDHFFQISTEISSDGRSKTLITFRVNNLFDASRVASIFRLI